MAKKIASLRVFMDEHEQINLSIQDVHGDVLSVSQFTLYANANKGRRPSFIDALRPFEASPLYDYFNEKLAEEGLKVSTGIFGANMKVSSVNDGPFTLLLDSKELF